MAVVNKFEAQYLYENYSFGIVRNNKIFFVIFIQRIIRF